MKRRDIHDRYDYFEYVRAEELGSHSSTGTLEVAVLDMNHSWPNLGHDSVIHAILDAATELREPLVNAGLRIRVVTYDVRRRLAVPPSPNGRFGLYVGTGGPGHLDPRLNDGQHVWSQGIEETAEWEGPLFHLFDDILRHPTAALIGICHTFGLMCRWSGTAHPELRETKSSGLIENVLSPAAADHPWFSRFARELPDGQHFRVVDNRLFDLVLDGGDVVPIAFENLESGVLTMAEFARAGSMPRVFGVNHHPEIIDRAHILAVLEEKRKHGEVSEKWFEERSRTVQNEMEGEGERQSRVTSHYTFLAPLKFHLERLIAERAPSTLSA